MDGLSFGIVDQSPIRQGGTVQQALRETVKLAQVAEGLGYHRYWVAEHHNSGGFAGTAPEGFIMEFPVRDISRYEAELLEFTRSRHASLLEKMLTEATLSDEIREGMTAVIKEFGDIFKPTAEA